MYEGSTVLLPVSAEPRNLSTDILVMFVGYFPYFPTLHGMAHFQAFRCWILKLRLLVVTADRERCSFITCASSEAQHKFKFVPCFFCVEVFSHLM